MVCLHRSLDGGTKLPQLSEAFQNLATCAARKKKLLLREVSDKDIRRVYDDFKASLKQYEIFVIVLATKSSGFELARSLEDGVGVDILVGVWL